MQQPVFHFYPNYLQLGPWHSNRSVRAKRATRTFFVAVCDDGAPSEIDTRAVNSRLTGNAMLPMLLEHALHSDDIATVELNPDLLTLWPTNTTTTHIKVPRGS